MTWRPFFMAVMLSVVGCHKDEHSADAATTAAVPGLETGVATSEQVRNVLRVLGVVAPAGEAPEVRDARAQLAEAMGRLHLAEQQVKRLEALARGAVASSKELEAARVELTAAQAAADRARQAQAAFGAQAGSWQLAADETWVLASVSQLDMAGIEAEAAASFAPDAFRERSFVGRVAGKPGYVDAATLTAPVRVRCKDAEHLLKPGMTGAVSMEAGAARAAVVVPTAAVVRDGAQAVVFVPNGAGHFAAKQVSVGVTQKGRTEITTGLAAGATVVTTGAASLLSAQRLPAQPDED